MTRGACCQSNSGPARVLLAAFLLLAGAAGAAARAAAQEPVFHALLRVHSALIYPSSSGQGGVDGDLFISAEGHTQGLFSNGNTTAERWLSQPSTGQASPGQLAALRSALEVNQVGLQQGSCVLLPHFVIVGTYDLNWYGSKNVRRSHLTVYLVEGAPPDTPPCPPEVCEILQAIIAYEDAVLQPEPGAFLGPCPAPPP
jgi:hypothetical protein